MIFRIDVGAVLQQSGDDLAWPKKAARIRAVMPFAGLALTPRRSPQRPDSFGVPLTRRE